MSEFDLSSRICFGIDDVIGTKFVKEFIRQARVLLEYCISGGCDKKLILNKFDELAGKKFMEELKNE